VSEKNTYLTTSDEASVCVSTGKVTLVLQLLDTRSPWIPGCVVLDSSSLTMIVSEFLKGRPHGYFSSLKLAMLDSWSGGTGKLRVYKIYSLLLSIRCT
jgi:hypothetical protein